MSIEILFDLQREVRRLFIAGSGMAAGDLNLKKLLPQLQKLGESAPVFKRMGQAVQEVLEADREQGASRLLDLGTLLNSVLYTQGRTEAAGEVSLIFGTTITAKTSVPYRKLHPVMEALTQKGQGRMEVLRQAEEERLLHDFRVIPAAVSALDDSFAELAEFLHRKVIPGLGVDALPELQRQFRLQGGKGDARRLELIYLLQKAEGIDTYLQAAREGSLEVRASAIELLGDFPDHESFLLEQADEKRKELRGAAYMALSKLGTERAHDRLYRALDSKDRELAIEPIRQSSSAALAIRVVRHAEAALEQFLEGKNKDESVVQLLADIHCLQGKKLQEVLELLVKMLSSSAFIVQETDQVQEAAIRTLLQLDMPEADQFAIEFQHAHNSRFITYSLRAAIKTLSPGEVFDLFAPEFKDKKSAAAKDLLRTMEALIPPMARQVGGSSEEAAKWSRVWDPRWVQLMADLDEEELVCRLAHNPDKNIVSYLVKKCKVDPNFTKPRTVHLLLTLFSLGYKDAPELLMEALEQPGSRQTYYLDRLQTALLHLLPGSYAERLQKFAESITYGHSKKQVLEIAETLQAKQPEANSDAEKGMGIWGWLKNKMS